MNINKSWAQMKKLSLYLISLLFISSYAIADIPSERCGTELTAKLEEYMVWLKEDLPQVELAINQNCKIEIMNLKELKEKERHEIQLLDEKNIIVHAFNTALL